MLELAIDCRLPNRLGDVLVAKLAGSAWGGKENKEFLIVQRDDPTLEASVAAAGGMLAYPYATYDGSGNMTQRSTWTFAPGTLGLVNLLDTTIALPIISAVAAGLLWTKSGALLLAPAVQQRGLLGRVWDTILGWLS